MCFMKTDERSLLKSFTSQMFLTLSLKKVSIMVLRSVKLMWQTVLPHGALENLQNLSFSGIAAFYATNRNASHATQ